MKNGYKNLLLLVICFLGLAFSSSLALAQCDDTRSVEVEPLTLQDIEVLWKTVNGAIDYEVEVIIPSIGHYSITTVIAPDTILLLNLSTPLIDNAVIEACVKARCSQGISRDVCRRFIFRTAIATINPVYKQYVDTFICPPPLIDRPNLNRCFVSFEDFIFENPTPPHIGIGNISNNTCVYTNSKYAYDPDDVCQCTEMMDSCGDLSDCIEKLGIPTYIFFNKSLCVQPKTNHFTTPSLTPKLSPNPIKTIGTLEYHLVDEERVSLRIFNVMGEEVYQVQQQQSVGSQTLSIETANLPEGIYFYRLETAQQTYNGKFMKAL